MELGRGSVPVWVSASTDFHEMTWKKPDYTSVSRERYCAF
nr:MAG TPA: hypothetical protein [Caudoviricetes sp.]